MDPQVITTTYFYLFIILPKWRLIFDFTWFFNFYPQAANDCDLEPVTYEFFTQAFVLYEEEVAVLIKYNQFIQLLYLIQVFFLELEWAYFLNFNIYVKIICS